MPERTSGYWKGLCGTHDVLFFCSLTTVCISGQWLGWELTWVGCECPLTYLSSLIPFWNNLGRLSWTSDTFNRLLFTLFDPSASSVLSQKRPTYTNCCQLYFYREQSLYSHREGESIWGRRPEAAEFGPYVSSVGEQPLLVRHGQEDELSASGNPFGVSQMKPG